MEEQVTRQSLIATYKAAVKSGKHWLKYDIEEAAGKCLLEGRTAISINVFNSYWRDIKRLMEQVEVSEREQ